MPTTDQRRLLALADEKPLQALHASAGRLRRLALSPTLCGVYVPSPVSDEYTVVLNTGIPYARRFEALQALVVHHVEAHNRTSVYVLTSDAACSGCNRLPQSPPADLRELRRSRSY